MTAPNVIVVDSAGLRTLSRELRSGVDTVLEMRDRLCVEECSMLPSSSSGLADELLQDARQRLHGLAGAYSTTAAALVMRADEVDTAQARWWQVMPDGLAGGVILPDGEYAKVPGGTFAGAGSTDGQTAISAAWGSGVTGYDSTAYVNVTGPFDPVLDTSNSIGYINLTGPYTQPTDSSDSTGYINVTGPFDPLGDSSNSVGYINLTGPYSQPSDPSDSTAYINVTGPFDPLGDSSNSPAIINLSIPDIGTLDPSAGYGEVTLPIPGSDPGAIDGFGGLYVWALGRQANLQNEFNNLTSGPSSSNGQFDFSTYNSLLTTNYDQSTALAQASDPSRSYYDVDLTGRSDPR
jgi:hypothetical protein